MADDQTPQGEADVVVDQESEGEGLVREPEKAARFFERAEEVTNTGSYDFAIELYRDGLKWDPEALDRGHKPMREVSLRRKQAGGKKPGMLEQAKINRIRDPKEKMAFAEYLLAKDPENAKYMEIFIQNALKVGATNACRWMCQLLVEVNRKSSKPSVDRYQLAVDAFAQVKDYQNASNVSQYVVQLKPNDQAALTQMKNLSAEATMQKGRYEEGEDFKGSLVDAKGQAADQDAQKLVKSKDYLTQEVERTQAEYEAEPGESGKLNQYIDALLARRNEGDEDKALEVLGAAYGRTNSFRWKERMDDIRIAQFRRRGLELRQKLAKDPTSAEVKQAAQKAAKEALAFEEQAYAARVKAYPTDMRLKYEYGRRLFANQKYDEAIPVLQEATNDPKHRSRAMSLLGQAFFNLEFFAEAIDTFRRAIADLEVSGDDISKELYYSLGRALEANNDLEEADKAYSQVMQWDFNYRDVRQRIQELRKRRKEQESGAESE